MTLRNRFINRLAELVGQEVTLKEDASHQCIEIRFISSTTHKQDNKEIQELVSGMKEAMSLIANHGEGVFILVNF